MRKLILSHLLRFRKVAKRQRKCNLMRQNDVVIKCYFSIFFLASRYWATQFLLITEYFLKSTKSIVKFSPNKIITLRKEKLQEIQWGKIVFHSREDISGFICFPQARSFHSRTYAFPSAVACYEIVGIFIKALASILNTVTALQPLPQNCFYLFPPRV